MACYGLKFCVKYSGWLVIVEKQLWKLQSPIDTLILHMQIFSVHCVILGPCCPSLVYELGNIYSSYSCPIKKKK